MSELNKTIIDLDRKLNILSSFFNVKYASDSLVEKITFDFQKKTETVSSLIRLVKFHESEDLHITENVEYGPDLPTKIAEPLCKLLNDYYDKLKS